MAIMDGAGIRRILPWSADRAGTGGVAVKWPASKPKQPDANLLIVPLRELVGLEDRLKAEGKRWSVILAKRGEYHVRTYAERLAELKGTT
jgi:hypothetical protein